jgi:hypothetical protein
MERWKEITEAPGYFISDQGRVKNSKGKVLNPRPNKNGYLRILPSVNGIQKKSMFVHQLVLSTFGPQQPADTTPDHINRIRTDNRIENLRWATKKDQIKNSVMNPPKGIEHPNSKLKEEDIIEIRRLLKTNMLQTKIAKLFNVAEGHITRIKQNKQWAHLQDKKS